MRGGGCGAALHQRGETSLGCPSRAERSRVSLCEKCRLTLRTPYLAPLPFSTASSAAFTSAGLNGRDVTRTSSAGSVVGCDGALFLCRYLVEGFVVGAHIQVALH